MYTVCHSETPRGGEYTDILKLVSDGNSDSPQLLYRPSLVTPAGSHLVGPFSSLIPEMYYVHE